MASANPGLSQETYVIETVSRLANARVLTIEYTFSPEANGSQQVEECLKVYRYVLDTLHVPSNKIAWFGGSGGGSLGLSVVLAIAARKLPSPAGACIASPMTSAHPMPSVTTNRDTDAFVGNKLDFWTMTYDLISGQGTPHAISKTHPDVSPLHGDFTGVCPLYLSCTKVEALYDDTVAVIRKARAAGVPVKATVANGLYHVWTLAAAWVPESREELAISGRWLAEHLHPGFADIY